MNYLSGNRSLLSQHPPSSSHYHYIRLRDPKSSSSRHPIQVMNYAQHCAAITADAEYSPSQDSPNNNNNYSRHKSSSYTVCDSTPQISVVNWGLEQSLSDSVMICQAEAHGVDSNIKTDLFPISKREPVNEHIAYLNDAEEDENVHRFALTARTNSFGNYSSAKAECDYSFSKGANGGSDCESLSPSHHHHVINMSSHPEEPVVSALLYGNYSDRRSSCWTTLCFSLTFRRCCDALLRCFTNRQVIKCFLAFLYLAVVMLVIAHLLVWVHMRSPFTKTCGQLPQRLPDIVLDHVQRQSWGFAVAEIMITSISSATFLLILLHQSRLVVLRRLFCILGGVFSIRAFCIISTSLTYSSPHLYDMCPPIHVITPAEFVGKALRIYAGFGLRIHGGVTCGDYIYSGHTCTLTVFNLIILMYAPSRRIYIPLKVASCITNVVGVICILLAHEHYTVDIVLAVAISVLVFNEYHNIAHHREMRQWDSWRLLISAPVTYFMERDGEGKVSNRLRIAFLGPCLLYTRHRYQLAQPQYRKSSVDLQ